MKKEGNNKKKKYLSFIIIFFLILSFLIFYAIKNAPIDKLYYEEKSNIDYRVNLKNNNYFDKESLENNSEKIKEYIAGLIENINMTFKYKYNLSDIYQFKYKYNLQINLLATERDKREKILYYKEYPIIEEKTIEENSNVFEINETFNLDYQYYNNIIDNFKKEFILSIDSYLEVVMNISIEGINNELINKINEIKLIVPLSEKTFEIEERYTKENSETLFKKTDDKSTMILYILIIIDSILLIFSIIKLIIYINKNKTYYKKELKKIIDEYDSIIVEINNMPNSNKKNIINVQSFLELVDARENGKSILHIETVKDKESIFFIINDNYIYQYVLEDKNENK